MKRDILTFLLFVFIATAMWYGHAMNSVRNTHVPVLITYTGKPGTIGLGAEGLPDTVMIEVRDAGKRLNTYHRDPLRLTIDLRPYIHGEKGTIRVPSDALRRSISDILQGTSHLIDSKPEEIVCSYFTEQEKSMVVVNRCTVTPANEYQLSAEPKLSHKTVKLYGEDKKLAAQDSIETEALTLTNITDTVDTRVALVVPAGLRAETDSINLRIITERFTEKKFTLPLTVRGVPEGYHIRLFPREVEVNVRVAMSKFAQVQAEDLRAVCVYTPERQDKLDVELHYTNTAITAAWAYPAVVEFLLEQ